MSTTPKTIKLALAGSAPDEFSVEIGMEFKRTFKRADAPFQIEKKWAKALLRSYDYFVEFEETEPEEITFAGLMKLKREPLDAKAREYGISEPEKLADKKAVANAILEAAKPKAKAEEKSDEANEKSDSDEKSEETEDKETNEG